MHSFPSLSNFRFLCFVVALRQLEEWGLSDKFCEKMNLNVEGRKQVNVEFLRERATSV